MGFDRRTVPLIFVEKMYFSNKKFKRHKVVKASFSLMIKSWNCPLSCMVRLSYCRLSWFVRLKTTTTQYSQFLFTTVSWMNSHSLVTENIQHDWTVTMVTYTSEAALSCQQVPKTLGSYVRVFLVIPVSDELSTTPRALTSSRVLSRAVA